jgi:hypothetical protein
MMRLPRFRFVAPESLAEAVDVLSSASPGDAMIVAGGTDLIPNMKRRQQVPGTLIGLRRIAELRGLRNSDGYTIGAGVTLTRVIQALRPGSPFEGLRQAAVQIATPQLRNMGTIGGNLCLDTRCNYYDQNYEWRKAIDFCMKKDGSTCWVATSSPKCLAVFVNRHRAGADRAGCDGHTARRRRLTDDPGQRAVSERRNQLSAAAARRNPDQRPGAAAQRMAEHLLEAAAPRLVRFSGFVGGRSGAVRG